MSTADGHVQVAPDSTGKRIDNSELQRDALDPARDATAGLLVYRQRVALGSGDDPNSVLNLPGEPGRETVPVSAQSIDEMCGLLRDIRDMLALYLSN